MTLTWSDLTLTLARHLFPACSLALEVAFLSPYPHSLRPHNQRTNETCFHAISFISYIPATQSFQNTDEHSLLLASCFFFVAVGFFLLRQVGCFKFS